MGNIFSSIFSGLFGTTPKSIFILGLDNAGKTTVLYRLHFGRVITTIPTVGFNLETVTYKNLTFRAFDLGGQEALRPYWRKYLSGGTDALVYVVDSTDKERLGISKGALFQILEEPELENAKVLVLANKQDREDALAPKEISNTLGLSTLKTHTWSIFKTSAKEGTGLEDAFDWLTQQLN